MGQIKLGDLLPLIRGEFYIYLINPDDVFSEGEIVADSRFTPIPEIHKWNERLVWKICANHYREEPSMEIYLDERRGDDGTQI